MQQKRIFISLSLEVADSDSLETECFDVLAHCEVVDDCFLSGMASLFYNSCRL